MNKLLPLKNLQKPTLLSHPIRSLSTSSSKFQLAESKVDEPKEVQIEVPWGHVAGKWYGSENTRPIVLVHGWQDNAGSFDKLIPLLLNGPNRSYLSIDLPGHGLSSRLPDGILYTSTNSINVLNIIRRHFKWDQMSFCSHSLGAHISSLFAALYPERCDLLICLDALMKPYLGNVDTLITECRKIGDDFLDLDQLNRSDKEPPTYTYAEIAERWAKQTKITTDAVEFMMKRGVVPSKANKNLFCFSRDVRLKIMEFGMSNINDDVQLKLIGRIQAPHLFIKANKSPEFEGKERYKKALEILTESNPKFEWRTVIGGHHCHLTEPKHVSDHISKFITKYHTEEN
ncbi:serine hydrolase-like protein isoform X2 [Sitodiplosis mosellana]|uniref:serine hydrolase-like protein isoform X2 n=1 Tax=Sitodiplosis mosellana TaxID=263140 RepID=UPI002444AD2F|nr:serine hydrolase-like protein isoform X2 [Sitodiplosis mosellana]